MSPSTRRVWSALFLTLALAGCGSDPYPGEPPGTLHIPLVDGIKSLDPVKEMDQISGTCCLNVYDQLFEFEYLARPFALKPCLADGDWEVSEDGLTCTIRIKKGVLFSDDPCFTETGGKGREIVASDFIFCFKRLMDSAQRSPGKFIFAKRVVGIDAFTEASGKVAKDPHRDRYEASAGYPDVPGFRALDDHTLQIQLVEPYPQFKWTLAMAYTSVYPHEAIKYYGQDFTLNPVGSGPYKVESVRPEHKIVFVKNPTYREDFYPDNPEPGVDEKYDRVADAGKRLPFAPRVVATVFKEQQPMWLYFLRGHLDRTSIPKDNYDNAIDAKTKELVSELKDVGVQLEKTARVEVIYDCFNMAHPIVGAPNGKKGLAIRAAISLASDHQWAIEHLYNGRTAELFGPVPRGIEEHDPELHNPWKRMPGMTRDEALEKARKVLADAGYPGGKGIPVLQKEVNEGTTSQQFFLAFQRDCADVGIRVEAYQTSWTDMLGRIRNKQATMWGISWGADYPEAQNFLQLFYGPNKSPGVNGSNYDNPEFNKLYEQALSMSPSPERKALYRKMERIVVDDCVWSIRYSRKQFSLMQPWLKNYKYNDLSSKYFKYCRVDTDLRKAKLREISPPNFVPLGIGLLGFIGLVAFTLRSARRTRRGW